MKYFIAILATFIIGATAQAEVKVYCVQISPKNSHGLIFEEATLTSSAGKAKLVPGRFGFGLTTEQGDGTISQDMLLESNRALSPSPAHSASSAQWKNAVPFLLPIEGAEYVAYFFPFRWRTE